MKIIKRTLLGIALTMCFVLTGCGDADNLTEDVLLQDIENEEKVNLDNWIGKYTFTEAYNEDGDAPMVMCYDIDIYKEGNQYYGDVVVNGHMTAINLKTKLYGNDEWISLVIDEYNPEHITGLSKMENTVLLSLGKQGENIYTYWGVLCPLGENLSYSGIYLEKVEAVQAENVGEQNRLEDWIGNYTFSEKLSETTEDLRDYDITIYEENGQYYGDLRISGEDIGIDVKAQIYGNDEWISLVLVEYNSEHESGLEDMENSVLLSLRSQGEEIYTYWGGKPVTNLLNDDPFVYYDSNLFFAKAGF